MCSVEEYYLYIVVFKGDDVEYSPIIKFTNFEDVRNMYRGTMHLLDPNLKGILPALEFIMHLPRFSLDLMDLHEEIIDKGHDESHNILIIPDVILPTIRNQINKMKPSLIIYADDCGNENIKCLEQSVKSNKVVRVSELSDALLMEYWDNKKQELDSIHSTLQDVNKQFWLKGEMISILPALFLARQFYSYSDTLNMVFNSEDVYEKSIVCHLNLLMRQKTLVGLGEKGFSGVIHPSKEDYLREYEKQRVRVPEELVISLPGVPEHSRKRMGLSYSIPIEERRAIRIIGIHRAIAKNAPYIEIVKTTNDLFEKMNELETNCVSGTNNKYVWKCLSDIGKMFEYMLNENEEGCLIRAKHITVFSDFPIGVAVMPGTTVPLQMFKQISYRPLSPLTRCLEHEMVKAPVMYMRRKCRVIFAECIKNTHENKFVRLQSDTLYLMIKNMEKRYPNVEVIYRETYTVNNLKDFINSNKESSILYISAHGYYSKERNMAGIMVGEEFWMADENDLKVPGIVLLSACHVSPRGSGAVCIADLFQRLGALAVLGTFIPVNAKRNTILMTRLFTYIFEAQTGNRQYRTLADAWSGIVSTNAIHEILQTSERFEKWMYSENLNGVVRMIDFQLNRCVGRLHAANSYEDTIAIVKEMLMEEGMEGKFDNIMSQKDYFPESIFYQFIGYPENAFFYNEIFEEVYNERDI